LYRRSTSEFSPLEVARYPRCIEYGQVRQYALGAVIVTGLICVLVGVLVPSRFLWITGSVLVFVGIVLLVLNLIGRSSRRYY
jgi:hypothetical protein